MGFSQGFANGFGLIDGAMRKNRAEARQSKMDAKEEVRYNKEQEALSQQRALQNQSSALGIAQAQDKLNHSAEDRKLKTNLMGLQIDNETEKLNKVKLETQQKRNESAASYIKLAASGADVGDKGRKAVNESVYAGVWNKFKGQVDSANVHFSKYDQLQSPEEVAAFLNDPETLKYANGIFSNEIYSREKATGNNYTISGMQVINGGIVPEFTITDSKGNVVSEGVPATVGKTSNKNDQIKPVSFSDMKKKVVETLSFANFVKSNPSLQKTLGLEPSKEYETVSEGSALIDKNTGKFVYKNEKQQESYTPAQASSALSRIYDKYRGSLGGQVDEELITDEDHALIQYLLPLAYPGNAPTPKQPRQNSDPLGLGL